MTVKILGIEMSDEQYCSVLNQIQIKYGSSWNDKTAQTRKQIIERLTRVI